VRSVLPDRPHRSHVVRTVETLRDRTLFKSQEPPLLASTVVPTVRDGSSDADQARIGFLLTVESTLDMLASRQSRGAAYGGVAVRLPPFSPLPRLVSYLGL